MNACVRAGVGVRAKFSAILLRLARRRAGIRGGGTEPETGTVFARFIARLWGWEPFGRDALNPEARLAGGARRRSSPAGGAAGPQPGLPALR